MKNPEKAELQAIRFDSSLFTAAQAKTWLKKHSKWGKVIQFEKAMRNNPVMIEDYHEMLDIHFPKKMQARMAKDISYLAERGWTKKKIIDQLIEEYRLSGPFAKYVVDRFI